MRDGGPRLRVVGVDGPPGADAPIMPAIAGGSTTPPTIMLAERAADLIRHGA
jgi:choline dehydrogenase